MNNIISQEEKDKIDQICSDHDINNYSINRDGSIDVNGDVYILHDNKKDLPLRFNFVSGNFNCNQGFLTSLKGSPIKVGKNFDCGHNNLISLEYGPSEVGGNFYCEHNKLTSLEHCPINIEGHFLCNSNKLTSLEHCPKKVGLNFECEYNYLDTLMYCPSDIGGDLYCENCGLPTSFSDTYDYDMSFEERSVFIKYMNYYDVWTPEFSENNMNYLVAEMNDGLR
jgi:hypothetical protein